MEGRRNPGDGRRFQREIVIVVAVDGGTPGGARSIEAPAPALQLCLRVVCSRTQPVDKITGYPLRSFDLVDLVDILLDLSPPSFVATTKRCEAPHPFCHP